ncbi:MAG TPA: hypothetical protein VMV82_10710 [Candidatus Dormibacteraeota bacterium]|nr:hypothetical protein [Candidatus Dormibacteraeota bacterium]
MRLAHPTMRFAHDMLGARDDVLDLTQPRSNLFAVFAQQRAKSRAYQLGAANENLASVVRQFEPDADGVGQVNE